jgi:hypothetical protein
MRICAALIIPKAKPQKPSLQHSLPVQGHGQELKWEVRVWALIRLYHLHTLLVITTTTKLVALPNGKRFWELILSSTPPWMHMEATRTGHDKLAILSRMAVSEIARTSGVIQHRYLGRGRMARPCWEGSQWTTRACMRALGWL